MKLIMIAFCLIVPAITGLLIWSVRSAFWPASDWLVIPAAFVVFVAAYNLANGLARRMPR